MDAALVWHPVPGQDSYRIQVLATEPRWVAFREDHWLAGRDKVAFGELLDEPFLALPESAGPLRDYWLAVPERGGEPVKVGAVVANADETFAAIEDGSGIVLISSGNVTIYQRPGVRAVPVVDLSPSQLAVAWRAGDHRVAIRDFVEAVTGPIRQKPWQCDLVPAGDRGAAGVTGGRFAARRLHAGDQQGQAGG